jgi:hypothetical protein
MIGFLFLRQALLIMHALAGNSQKEKNRPPRQEAAKSQSASKRQAWSLRAYEPSGRPQPNQRAHGLILEASPGQQTSEQGIQFDARSAALRPALA